MTLFEVEERLRELVEAHKHGRVQNQALVDKLHALVQELERDRLLGVDGKAARP